MKKLIVGITMLGMLGCTPNREVVDVIHGNNGANGHSIVSQYNESVGCECAHGGTRLDLYLDMDDSLSATESDLYQGSLIACNGSNGLNGIDGLSGTEGEDGHDGQQGIPGSPGPMGTIGPMGMTGSPGPMGPIGRTGPIGATGLTGPIGLTGPAGSSGATIVSYGSSSCTALTGGYYGKAKSNTYDIYLSSSCKESDKVITLNDANSTIWLSTTSMAVYASSSVRVINFNL